MFKTDPNQTEFVDFYLPFGGKLQTSNRWVKLAAKMPWQEVERCYAESFAGTGMGAPAKSGRIAYGALIIKEQLGISDEETVEQITENPYLQYFLGLHEFRQTALFDPSMMVHFRSRFSSDHHQRINDQIIQPANSEQAPQDTPQEDPPEHSGKLLIDATCTPADIRYPIDLSLLNEAREKTEHIIDCLHQHLVKTTGHALKKPRTYRRKARQDYLAVAKQKSPVKKTLRKANGKQLRYLKRNLAHIAKMVESSQGLLTVLSGYDYKCLLVIHTLYEQQLEMYAQRTRTVPDRIVSISQPHVRAIVRGKAARKVEFGAKLSVSHQKDGYVSLDRLSWDAYNESSDLIEQIETYKERFGYYPASVHADQIYRTRSNRAYCKSKGIRLSGKPLGRPRKPTAENQAELEAAKELWHQDELARIPIEGKFGNSKRRGTLGRIMAKLSDTSESVIHVGLIVLNLQTWLRNSLICSRGKIFQSVVRVLKRMVCYFEGLNKRNYHRYKPASIFSIAGAHAD